MHAQTEAGRDCF